MNIGGVKKWLQPAPVPIKNEQDKIVLLPKLSKEALTVIDPLNPVVLEPEEQEYERYIAQFKPGMDIGISDPDLKLVRDYVSMAKDWNVESKDESLYSSFIHSAGNIDTLLGIGARSIDLQRFESYSHWVRIRVI